MAYFLEAGLILLVAPWLPLWQSNGWLHATPALSSITGAVGTRLLVSLAGAMTLLAGLGELGGLLLSRERRARDPGADGTGS